MGGPSYIWFEGHRLDQRTADMIVAARVVCDAPLEITQGCYNNGAVAASAGTHDGGGAVDIRAKTLTNAQVAEAVLKLRHVGFAAWHRLPSEGKWVEHIHAIAIGCPDLSRGAASQVTAYRVGRNGLANKGPDSGPRTYVGWTWEKYKRTYPDLLTEDELSAKDVQEINAYTEKRLDDYFTWMSKNVAVQLANFVPTVKAQAKDAAGEAVAEYFRVLYNPEVNGTAGKNHQETEALLRAVLTNQGTSETDIDEILAGVRTLVGAEEAPKA